ncbi:MAG: deoxyguanosinetriphosphate triphosphohydrolase [Rhodospirillales bacterium]|nr:deoxyguanosinetriphosphate triphosphohydrolase [Rhodospirillales bacterium]
MKFYKPAPSEGARIPPPLSDDDIDIPEAGQRRGTSAETDYNYCALPLAPYACRPERSAGRLHDEPESRYRTAFQRDRDRIIHATAFRRLRHKTQVFVNDEGDHYRTRLTHTLEVAQVARTLARALSVNEDLTESIALAHDLGHTPFAHIGEEYLARCMDPYGGFSHNDQSLRVLTVLERRYPRWNGLNLSWETLEGLAKHGGPVVGDIPFTLAQIQAVTDFQLDLWPSVEAQIAGLSDDIAYNAHDVEDGLRAGLFTLDDFSDVPLANDILETIRDLWPDMDAHYTTQELIREMMGAMVEDVLSETNRRISEISPQSPDDIRQAGRVTVAFSDPMRDRVDEMRDFLFERMYRHYTVNRMWLKVERVITEMFNAFMTNHHLLPTEWQAHVAGADGLADDSARARVIADYIAGMTDRYALREHEKLFNIYKELR